jgi:hypothetical protein
VWTRPDAAIASAAVVPAMATGGVAPARLPIGDLLPDVLQGRIQPGRVLDRAR